MNETLSKIPPNVDYMLSKVLEKAGFSIIKEKYTPPIEVKECATEDLPYHQYLVVAVAGCDLINLLIRIHFNLKDAKHLSCFSYNVSFDDISISKTMDFMKELLNLIVGRLKKAFATQEINLGNSIPIALSGFNDVFFTGLHDNSKVKCFDYHFTDKKITLSLKCDILKNDAYSKIEKIDLTALDDNENEDEKALLF